MLRARARASHGVGKRQDRWQEVFAVGEPAPADLSQRGSYQAIDQCGQRAARPVRSALRQPAGLHACQVGVCPRIVTFNDGVDPHAFEQAEETLFETPG